MTDPRQQAIDTLTQVFILHGKDAQESREVATAVIDRAIADRGSGK